jgi:O-antigen/teichoic acid export membrane protein
MSQKKLIKAGVYSIISLVVTQAIRFGGNIVLAKLLAPSAFGLMAVVNMLIVGMSLLSDIGLRMVVIQRNGALTEEFLNTVWTLQVFRGIGISLTVAVAGVFLIILQHAEWLSGNVYADPLLPYLVLVTAISVLFNGFDSTKPIAASRALDLGRLSILSTLNQIITLGIIIIIANVTRSPWALVVGSVTGAVLQCISSHFLFPGARNTWRYDRAIVSDIFKKVRWLLLSSPLTFLELNGAVMILGALLSPSELGYFMIAFSMVGVLQMVSQNLAANIFFPGLSACIRDKPYELARVYKRFQLTADAILVTAAGGLLASGQTIIGLLFDNRYAMSGTLLSLLAIGLIGVRYCVVEQLFNANGHFKFNPPVIISRVTLMAIGVMVGHHMGGLQGAAIGISISWFAGWPILLWYRAKTIPWPWLVETAAIGFLGMGYGLGTVFNQLVQWIPITGLHR